MAVAQVYGAYEALMHTRAEAAGLGGSLLVLAGLNGQGTVLATGANIAGAATLAIEEDAARARGAVRGGVCDFVVTTLDEALRILKNEIRKKKPVSVVLVSEPTKAIRECVERGVRPELVASPDLAVLGGEPVPAVPSAHPLEVRWVAPAGQSLALTRVDALAAAMLDGHADPRRRWLSAAPRYVGRPMLTERYVRMNADEAARFWAAFEAGVADGSISRAVTLSGV